ncbi:MAG: Kiwa anti-phage protein KwaB-like domain-containing protein [Candidatus Saccharimonadales bacterium]
MQDETSNIPQVSDVAKITETTDIFLWANTTDAIKNDIDLEVFLFNKNYTPYAMRFSPELERQIRALFLYDIVNDVNMGAGTGLSVRDYEMSEAEEDVLLRTELEKAGKAETLIHLIEHERSNILEFSEEEHEFKRMKGIIVRFAQKDKQNKPFYVAKGLQQGNTLKGTVSWEINGGKFEQFKADVGLKIPADSQVMITNGDIFIFNQAKFEKLFQYEYKKQLLADQKAAEIAQHYKLSFPEGLDLQTLVREKKNIVTKLQKLELGGVSQEKALEYADDMQLDLMTDDNGAIIIMDGHDLTTFVNLINEDYITSAVTGKRYEIKSKKLLDEPDGEPPRG